MLQVEAHNHTHTMTMITKPHTHDIT